ncbi:hypothetical protein GGP50_002666 [Salinibacter ruber]|nr:hypothetical protein [Salinibacter ruber]
MVQYSREFPSQLGLIYEIFSVYKSDFHFV